MKCENCEYEHDGNYGSGRFCSTKCARSFSTKVKRDEINKKVSKTLTKEGSTITKECDYCKNTFISYRSKNRKYCTLSCARKDNWTDDEYRDNITSKIRKRCSKKVEKDRLRYIGRMGGFGKKGYTENGTRYESLFEKKCFDYLECKNIKFEPHKLIPNTSKVSDVYFNEKDLWVELDGINRDKRKKWLNENYTYWVEKLQLYKDMGLNIIIIKDYDDFIKLVESF